MERDTYSVSASNSASDDALFSSRGVVREGFRAPPLDKKCLESDTGLKNYDKNIKDFVPIK